MKSFNGILLFIIMINSAGAQWEKISDINVGVTGQLSTAGSAIYLYGSQQGFKLYRSSDNGTSWTDIASNFPYTVQFIYEYKSELFAVTSILGSGNWLFYVSQDDGITWAERSRIEGVTGNGAILRITSDGDNLFAVSNRKSVYKSTNSGNSWTEILINDNRNFAISTFAASGNLYSVIALNIGAIISEDAGVSWKDNNPSTVVSGLFNHGGTIFGLSFGGGVFKFNKASQTWYAVNNGIADNGSFQIPKSMCSVGNSLYVSSTGLLSQQALIYSSMNNGESWSQINMDGIPLNNGAGSADFITANSSYLFSYFYSGAAQGTYKTAITPTSVPYVEGMPDSYNLFQNYPNPFNPTTKIKFSVAEKSFVSLRIFNPIGEEVESLLHKELNAGIYELEWNATAQPSGTYYYSLTGNNFSSVKKMILVK